MKTDMPDCINESHNIVSANMPGLQDIGKAIESLPAGDDWAVRAAEIFISAGRRWGCSDLHIMSRRDGADARVRRDGMLMNIATVPAERVELLIARFKVLARLPAFIRQEPQDGRIEWAPKPGELPLTLRVSFLPTLHGENMVLRFPEERAGQLKLDQLGMESDVLQKMERLLARPEGTILLTGPSSSGKTTTMYAILDHLHGLHGDRLHFLTIEDPIERDLGFAGQVAVNDAQGLTFARALRSALRQDPNVIMIGEIRDSETAQISVQAGMTGHLVLSTIHAGRAARVFTRILSMGVEPYLAASALTGVIAQRLVRRLCSSCRTPAKTGAGMTAEGCEACMFTGNEGRMGIYEVIEVAEALREQLIAGGASDEIARTARRNQTGDIASTARRLAEQGEISWAEFAYVVSSEEGAS